MGVSTTYATATPMAPSSCSTCAITTYAEKVVNPPITPVPSAGFTHQADRRVTVKTVRKASAKLPEALMLSVDHGKSAA